MTNKTQHKFKIGDRVKVEATFDGITKSRDGKIFNYDKSTSIYYVRFIGGKQGAYFFDQLALIDSGTSMSPTPKESPDVSDDSVKYTMPSAVGEDNPTTSLKELVDEYKKIEPALPCPACGAMIEHEAHVYGKTIIPVDPSGENINMTIPEYGKYLATKNKDFDPEKLTFDGVEIRNEDKVKVKGRNTIYTVHDFGDCLRINKSDDNLHAIALESLNIIEHFPNKTELETLEEEVKELYQAIIHASNGSLDDFIENKYVKAKYKGLSLQDLLDRYYQARKRLEEFNSNNK